MGELVIGKHVYGELYGCPSSLLWDEEAIVDAVKKAAEKANATLLEIRSWRIGGSKGGVSVLALVVESHIAVHTWPLNNYVTVDVYTCGEKTDPWSAFKYLVDFFKPKRYTVHYSDRSQLPVSIG